METVKSLQMEPLLEQPLRRLPRELPRRGLQHPPARQHLQRRRQRAGAADDARHPRASARWIVMRNDGFTIGMLVAFQMFAEPPVAADAAPGRPVAGVPAGQHRGQAPGRHHGRAGRALLAARRARGHGAAAGSSIAGPRVPLRRATCRYLLREPQPAAAARRSCVALDGPVRLRQEHARQAAARLLPAERRPHPARRPRHPPPVGQRTARSTSAWCRRRRCCSPARSTTT